MIVRAVRIGLLFLEAAGNLLQVGELALIQRLLPEELFFKIFEKLAPYTLGRIACVCQQFQDLTLHSGLWKAACRQAFMSEDPTDLDTARQKYYR